MPTAPAPNIAKTFDVANLCAIIVGAAGAHSGNLIPLLVSFLSADTGFGYSMAGAIGGASLLGISIAVFAASLFPQIRSKPWLFVSAALIVSCNFAARSLHTGEILFLLRCVAGLAEGLLIAAMSAFAGRSGQASKIFAQFFVLHLLAAGFAVMFWETLATTFHPFGWMAAGGVVAALFIPFMKTQAHEHKQAQARARFSSRQPNTFSTGSSPGEQRLPGRFLLLLLMVVILLVSIAVNGFWSFLVTFGIELGKTTQEMQLILFTALISGLAGAMLAWRLSSVPAPRILYPSLIGMTFCTAIGFLDFAALLIAIAAPLFMFLRTLLNPFLLGLGELFERPEAASIAGFALLYFGLAIGPVLTGLLSDSALTIGWAIGAYSVVLALSIALLAMLLWQLSRSVLDG